MNRLSWSFSHTEKEREEELKWRLSRGEVEGMLLKSVNSEPLIFVLCFLCLICKNFDLEEKAKGVLLGVSCLSAFMIHLTWIGDNKVLEA